MIRMVKRGQDALDTLLHQHLNRERGEDTCHLSARAPATQSF